MDPVMKRLSIPSLQLHNTCVQLQDTSDRKRALHRSQGPTRFQHSTLPFVLSRWTHLLEMPVSNRTCPGIVYLCFPLDDREIGAIFIAGSISIFIGHLIINIST
jgi:hypothetical protein